MPRRTGGSLPEALAKAYQTNPQLNAERARQRATDENVPQALAGYRPQIVASLSAGLQSVRNLLPDNTIQTANLKPWTIGVTVTQTLFNGFKTANSVRVAELQVQSGREALRNVGQGVLLDAVTAYTNVLANQSLVEAQRANVAFLRETQGITQKRLNAGDVTPTDTAQAEARLNRGLADLNAAEVTLAISQATYAQVIGNAPAQLRPAETVDRLSAAQPRRRHRDRLPRAPGGHWPRASTSTSPRPDPRRREQPVPSVRCRAASAAAATRPTLGTFGDRSGLDCRPVEPCRSTTAAPPPRRPARPRKSLRRAAWCSTRSAIRRAPRRSAPGCPRRRQDRGHGLESEVRAATVALQGVQREAPAASAPPSTCSTRSRI